MTKKKKYTETSHDTAMKEQHTAIDGHDCFSPLAETRVKKKRKKMKRDEDDGFRLDHHEKASLNDNNEDEVVLNVFHPVRVKSNARHNSAATINKKNRRKVLDHPTDEPKEDDTTVNIMQQTNGNKTNGKGDFYQHNSQCIRESKHANLGIIKHSNNENNNKKSQPIPQLGKLVNENTRPTVSIAVAGSIVDNAQSVELATMLAGQIARAAVIFRIDEIVVFDDCEESHARIRQANDNLEGGLFMAKILEYLEVPQYLRRALIPMQKSLCSVGKLPPLDAPHHLRKHEWKPFREGVVLETVPSSGSGSYVDVGLDKEIQVAQLLKPGTRVTVFMGHSKNNGDVPQIVERESVRQAGYYWGYTVRYASCLSAVFDECPFETKYDFCIGTSEHGKQVKPVEISIPKFQHLLIAFGGLSGLEESLELDKKLTGQQITRLFDQYLNTCPNQGSRTIRTEEAILISLQFLQEAIQGALREP